MSKRISFGLSVNEIQNAIKEVQQYQSDLNHKCEVFCQRLVEHGIQVAQTNVGGYGKYISFRMELSPAQNGYKAILVATNTGLIKSEWQTKEGVKTADVSPILMAEFGSGLRAKNPAGIPGVGTGTFPGATHSFQEEGWYYQTLDGVWHHSYGVKPTMPMYNAGRAMHEQIYRIAREVFGGG